MIGWIDAASGASGDMLLGALIDAGVEERAIARAIHTVAPERVELTTSRVRRSSIDALHTRVEVAESTAHRGLPDILAVISQGDVEADVSRHAAAVFTRLAEVEAEVHGIPVSEVHFHEVGALDAVVDIVGVCAGMVALGLDELHCSPVAVGSGTVETRHGLLSVPPPAVAALLAGVPTYAGPAAAELCTPTGAALLRHFVTHWGGQPLMTVQSIGSGAGTRDFGSHPNLLRLLVGATADPTQAAEPASSAGATSQAATGAAVVLETNVDDLDPRLWPQVLGRLFDAGASDAWLTPILMKKGRPAHTLSVLSRPDQAAEVQAAIFSETSAIGLRSTDVGKVALAREFRTVAVGGLQINVKVARLDGTVVSVQPEFDDVVSAAGALGRPVKAVLAEAAAAAGELWSA